MLCIRLGLSVSTRSRMLLLMVGSIWFWVMKFELMVSKKSLAQRNLLDELEPPSGVQMMLGWLKSPAISRPVCPRSDRILARWIDLFIVDDVDLSDWGGR